MDAWATSRQDAGAPFLKRSTAIYPAMDIAKRLVEKKPGLTLMAIQKLVYIAHGIHLALRDRPLINEVVQAWRYGPVIPSLYHSLKHNGPNPISYIYTPYDGPISSDADALLDFIIRSYGDMPASKLMAITHMPGSPWSQVYDDCVAKYGNLLKSQPIENDLIRDYYLKRIRKHHDGNQTT